jgi:hypothetical protein
VPAHYSGSEAARQNEDGGSIIVVLDAPLLPIQCQRLTRRETTGLLGPVASATTASGDMFIAFSTANHIGPSDQVTNVRTLASAAMTSLFRTANALDRWHDVVMDLPPRLAVLSEFRNRAAHRWKLVVYPSWSFQPRKSASYAFDRNLIRGRHYSAHVNRAKGQYTWLLIRSHPELG